MLPLPLDFGNKVADNEYMTTTQAQRNAAANNVAQVINSKHAEAMRNGATEAQADDAVKALWLGYLLDIEGAI